MISFTVQFSEEAFAGLLFMSGFFIVVGYIVYKLMD